MRARTTPLLLLLAACRPPDAPEELDELCSYLFTHAADENTRELEAGLENLEEWLDARLDETIEGYAVTDLSQEAVDLLDDTDRDVTDIAGAAVGGELSHDVDTIAEALVEHDQAVVFPETYVEYERTFLTDGDCFVPHDCDGVDVTNTTTSEYPFHITVVSTNIGQYRWVEYRGGLAMVQRTWLTGPATVDVDWLSVDQQYYLVATLPRDDGAVRLQATWVVAGLGDSPVPESTALNLVIDSMKGLDTDLEAYLDGS